MSTTTPICSFADAVARYDEYVLWGRKGYEHWMGQNKRRKFWSVREFTGTAGDLILPHERMFGDVLVVSNPVRHFAALSKRYRTRTRQTLRELRDSLLHSTQFSTTGKCLSNGYQPLGQSVQDLLLYTVRTDFTPHCPLPYSCTPTIGWWCLYQQCCWDAAANQANNATHAARLRAELAELFETHQHWYSRAAIVEYGLADVQVGLQWD